MLYLEHFDDDMPPVGALRLIREIGNGAPDISWQEWLMFENYAYPVAEIGDYFIIGYIESNDVIYKYIIHRINTEQKWSRIIINHVIGLHPHENYYYDISWHREYAEAFSNYTELALEVDYPVQIDSVG